MNRLSLFIAFLIIGINSYCQIVDSSVIIIDEIIITATRTERKLNDIPGQVELISSKKIENFPVNNVDDILKIVANVYVNRSWGIFSKNSSVTMRGLEGSDRTLVMIDGVPKNKLSGAPVNWHSINSDNVERIEVTKGPASTLYGNNAMGGVINIITKKPVLPLEGSVKVFGGRYNTFGGSLNLMGSEIKQDKGLYWDFNAIYRKGDGYIFELPENLDETDVPTYLQEYGAGTKIGYQFNKANSFELIYDYYDELRGAGRQIFEEAGSFDKFITNSIKGRYIGDFRNSKLQILSYYQYEDYNNQKEAINDYNEYKLSDANTYKSDYGTWITWSKLFFKHHHISLGGEIKYGSVLGDEIYRTSPDIINYNGFMGNYALFLQDEMSFVSDRLKVIFGIRNDLITFISGEQQITDPSKATGFVDSFYESFRPNNWNAISPKLAFLYHLNNNSEVYLSYSTGIKPPKLDDLCKSGKINKGFRLANPELKPETLTNYEIGYKVLLSEKIYINTAIYYSVGNDFQYLVGTGDSIDTGSSELKPVLYRANVSTIGIKGAEMMCNYKISKNITFYLSYAYNDSKILKYQTDSLNPLKDLSGLYIVEVSPHLFYAGTDWNNKFFSANINCNYVGEQWYDDENSSKIEDYFIVNMKLSKQLKKKFKIYLDIQNLLDIDYIDRKGQVSPGRFIIGGVKYNL
jgi:iron complex outermembrane receptor protein